MSIIREETGIPRESVDSLTALIESMGGSVLSLSALGDWMRVRLPSTLIHEKPAFLDGTSTFLEASSKRGGFITHHVAAGLRKAGLESHVTHMELTHPDDDRVDAISRPSGRKLKAVKYENTYDAIILPPGSNYQMFTRNKSEAVQHIGMWLNQPTMFVQCQGADVPYLSEDGADCTETFDEVTIILTPSHSSYTNDVVTLRLDIGTDVVRKTCKDVQEVCDLFDASGAPLKPTGNTFVYGIPLYKYALPNVLYQATMHISINGLFSAVTIDPWGNSSGEELFSRPRIYNYANSSVWSLREAYGVDADLQGTQNTTQGTFVYVAVVDSSVNETAVNEYLALNGILSQRPLVINDLIAPNNASICLDIDGECGEEMMDVEVLQSFAPNATTVFTPSEILSNNVTVALEMVLQTLDSITEPDTELDIVSISWAYDYSQTLGLTIDALENRLKKLASLGKTIVAATGDGGADSFPGFGCFSTGSSLVSSFPGTAWPAVSPWATAVGATQYLALGPDFETKEVSCTHATNGGITSSGGFSGKWLNISTPIWQKQAVSSYLRSNNGSTFSGFPDIDTPNFNPVGRGYPDISAYGAFFPILSLTGKLDVFAGTSLSAPTVASIFTLANQKLLSDGYQRIGYANPMLYWMAEECPDVFNDVTFGDNQPGVGWDLCPYGYPAAPGWDPVTGLGTINFNPFIQCVKKWQDKDTYPVSKSEGMSSQSGAFKKSIVPFCSGFLMLLYAIIGIIQM